MLISNLFTWFAISMVCFLPILFWGYLFSFVDESDYNRRRFLVGILAGSISVFPIVFMDRIFEISSLKEFNIFHVLSSVDNYSGYIHVFISLTLVLLVLAVAVFSFGLLFRTILSTFRGFVRSIFSLLIFTIILSVLFLFIDLISLVIPTLNSYKIDSINFGTAVFDSLKLVVFYYAIIAFLEESSKHFSFLSSSIFSVTTIKKGVLYSVFVALGFSFLENILYLLRMKEENGFGYNFFIVFFYRSFFSIFIHVFSSAIFGYFFTKAYLAYQGDRLVIRNLKIFLYGIGFSILIHLSFDVLLTMGKTGLIFIYFIFGYFFVTKAMINKQ